MTKPGNVAVYVVDRNMKPGYFYYKHDSVKALNVAPDVGKHPALQVLRV